MQFGLVMIPVRLYAATVQHAVCGYQLHGEDVGRIRSRRVCSVCGRKVPFADVAKGLQLPDGRRVMLTEDDLQQLPLPSARSLEVVSFVPTEQVDPIYFQRSYYLEPDRPAVRPYVLLRDALLRTGRLGIAKVTLRQRETIAALRARPDVLVLHMMRWPDEIRTAQFSVLASEDTPGASEVALATALAEQMGVAEFDPEMFDDDYQTALAELVEAKAAGNPLPELPQPAPQPVDLMEALRRSIDQFSDPPSGLTDWRL